MNYQVFIFFGKIIMNNLEFDKSNLK